MGHPKSHHEIRQLDGGQQLGQDPAYGGNVSEEAVTLHRREVVNLGSVPLRYHHE